MEFLVEAIRLVTWQHVVMWIIGGLLIFLAIKKEMEPALLLPIGFGAILVNIPLSNVIGSGEIGGTGIIQWLFNVGIEASEALPLLLFIGIGAMIDFEPLIVNPKLMILGAFAQLGIFLTLILAVLLGFPIRDNRCGGRPDFHTRRDETRQQLYRAYYGSRVLVYGARSDYSAGGYQMHHH